MNDERRFTDEEVARILDVATEVRSGGGALGAGASGLSLRELKEIAEEAGIEPAAIDRAVATLDRPTPVVEPDRSFLGQTIGVGRSLALPGPMSDDEWHQLVVDLRTTFDAEGKIQSEGRFRSWSNSNLQALVEPTADGVQLRLRTLKGNARVFQGMGAAFVGASGLLGILNLLGAARDPGDIVLFAVMGVAFFLASRLTVPSWARTRERQFEEILERARARALAASTRDDSGPASLGRPDGDGG